jgi:hypothetical protein
MDGDCSRLEQEVSTAQAEVQRPAMVRAKPTPDPAPAASGPSAFLAACDKFLAIEAGRWQARDADGELCAAGWQAADEAQEELLEVICGATAPWRRMLVASRVRCFLAVEEGTADGQISPTGQRLLGAILRDLLAE